MTDDVAPLPLLELDKLSLTFGGLSALTDVAASTGCAAPLSSSRTASPLAIAVYALTPARATSRSGTWSSILAASVPRRGENTKVKAWS